MTDHALAPAASARICPDCDGFASAAVSSGGRDRNGHLRTVTVYCQACHGIGTLPLRRRFSPSQWEVAA
ncbi:hypothetical protein GCM10011579_059930 [Streptomyces albiflavescens]|uniref:Uncharacterized protein n=1 Tax=Streptomyces albiflavescens TaxID=1623582 RepID=A0A917Y9G4_9ACTN|nr:hypothetical protein [Streptomyces albiflavescens]GGN77560.1 hypothetical protein GCM10011579_059930 [Streptomyces albiflavescens]